ncbi:MAG: polysaccharide deacetylase family protein [Candidatus Sumerlaeota bacterium]|nr:polysaccharide deacetylase family protein [Candidatus Sumerlaeota bacterium]
MSTQPTPNVFDWPGGRRGALSLTFDDARLSQIDEGISILNRYGVKATFYVSMKNVEKRLEGWRAAVATGHEIGNHTLRHPCSGNFPFITPERALEHYTLERMEADLTEANEAIRSTLRVTPETFAYPCGQTFVGRGEHLKSYIPLVARRFLVGRIAFNETPNRPDFCDLAQATSFDVDQASVDYLRELVDITIQRNAWAIFMSHETADADKRQTLSLQTLDALCRLLVERRDEIWVDTVASVGRFLREKRAGQSSAPLHL